VKESWVKNLWLAEKKKNYSGKKRETVGVKVNLVVFFD